MLFILFLQDEVAQVLVNIFDNHGSLHILLWNLFKDEVTRFILRNPKILKNI